MRGQILCGKFHYFLNHSISGFLKKSLCKILKCYCYCWHFTKNLVLIFSNFYDLNYVGINPMPHNLIYRLFLIPYPLFPIPYTLSHIPYPLFLIPYSLFLIPYPLSFILYPLSPTILYPVSLISRPYKSIQDLKTPYKAKCESVSPWVTESVSYRVGYWVAYATKNEKVSK